MLPSVATITGLVLAGGRALRMGGVDKGLQEWRGRPLIDHVLARFASQVHDVMISANRNQLLYAERTACVLADDGAGFDGPLAGILAGLRAARTPWLAVVPCDAPRLPLDLVRRLADGVHAARPAAPAFDAASAAAGLAGACLGTVVERAHGVDGRRLEPVYCLLPTTLADELARYLGSGGRKVAHWVVAHATPVPFAQPEDADAFANLNTLADLGG